MTGGLGIHATARYAAHFQWIEEQIFEILGGWSVSLTEPEAKLLVARHAAHHGWHAQLWAERRPNLREASIGDPESADWLDLIGGVQAGSGEYSSILKLAGMYRVLLPRLTAQYSNVLASTAEVADKPVIRTIQLVMADEREDAQEGKILLQSLLGTADAVSHTERWVAQLEAIPWSGPETGDRRTSTER